MQESIIPHYREKPKFEFEDGLEIQATKKLKFTFEPVFILDPRRLIRNKS